MNPKDDEKGLEAIFKRHKRHKLAISNAVKALNLKLFADENHLSQLSQQLKQKE